MKKFNCIEIKDRGAAIVQARIAGMTLEKKLEYWRQRTEELRERQRAMRLARSAEDPGASPSGVSSR